ncbi:hypothetical protein TWF506_006199 [Arthrobotrys conoides]|uniref:Uncharacterized protein n=1 Tax=Arthrobotrys conoides TaxID=74498 RepID=A0AAN8NLN3_9PEZI
MIKRKPVANGNPSVNTNQESQAKAPNPPAYRIPRKPLSPVAVVPKAFIWPTVVEPTKQIPVESSGTTYATRIENVDGNDHKAFQARASQNNSIEHETQFHQVYTRENVVSGDSRPSIFDTTASRAEVPTNLENATIVSQSQRGNSSTSKPRGLEFENSETILHNSTIENSAKGTTLEDGRPDIYEEFIYQFNGETRALTLITTETLLEKIEIQQKMILDTGFACGDITRSSVGPISKMFHRWFTSQNLSGWPLHLPADLPFESTAELDSLLSVMTSNDIDSIPIDPVEPLLRRKYWNTLWKISVVIRCVCNQLFSTGTVEDLYLSYARMPTDDKSLTHQPVGELISALSREVSDAISKNWLNKGYILLKAGRIWNGAQSVLKYLYHYQLGCFPIDECHQFRNAVLLGFWKQFLEHIASGKPQLEPPQPFNSISELFGVLQAFEKPHEPARYFPNSHPDLQYLVMTNFSNPLESEKYQLVRKEDEYLQEYLLSRQRAIRKKNGGRRLQLSTKCYLQYTPVSKRPNDG